MLQVIPIEFAAAQAWVATHHRHHPPVVRDKFRCACADADGVIGVIQIARPKARMLDKGDALEVVRLAVLDSPRAKNACSLLYSRAARAAEALGYSVIYTYTLPSEGGASLRAAGWTEDGQTKGGEWTSPSRKRKAVAQPAPKTRWKKELRP